MSERQRFYMEFSDGTTFSTTAVDAAAAAIKGRSMVELVDGEDPGPAVVLREARGDE